MKVLEAESELSDDLDIGLQARTYFLHHSVGGDVLNGVVQLAKELGRPAPPLVDLNVSVLKSGPIWLEECGGENCRPVSKIEAFANSVRSLADSSLQVAFMKFCFVDFDPSTNEDELFDCYRRTIADLRQRSPRIVFAHVTVPLAVCSHSMKDCIKRLIGYPIWNDTANGKRSRFNRRLLETFDADPIFDLARIQSTKSNGSLQTFLLNGEVTPSMVPAYSSDGGHLNGLGQRLAAAEFIRFVAAAVRRAALRI
jgi:hypothetical protein